MFWADKKAEETIARFKAEIAEGKEIVVRDEKTASGHPHIGSLVGVAVHDTVTRVLKQNDVNATFYYEINDTDPMDGMPVYLDESVYREHMGKPLSSIPAPDDSAASLAEYFGNDFKNVISEAGYTPQFYYLSTVYREGRMNEVIRLALQRADTIRKIYKDVSGSEKPDDWLPLNVVCEECGKVGTTKVTSFDGEKVSYVCQKDAVEWAHGCGHQGEISPFDGNATLPWKVEWAAKFKFMNVSVEGAGKDHSTKGGARDVADRIAREVFEYEPPVNIPYEFFLVGGKKMSSSKGSGATAREVSKLLPPHILTLALVGRDINRQKNFDLEGDSILLLFDQYDSFANEYWTKQGNDPARVFEIIHAGGYVSLLEERFLPRFSQVAFLVQMPHVDLEAEVLKMKGEPLTDADREEVTLRTEYAKRWLKGYADERFIYTLQESIPESAGALTDIQKEALRSLGERIEALEVYDGKTVHELTHEVKEASGLTPKEFFSAIYIVFLGKDSGPQVGWFFSALEKEFVVGRLKLLT